MKSLNIFIHLLTQCEWEFNVQSLIGFRELFHIHIVFLMLFSMNLDFVIEWNFFSYVLEIGDLLDLNFQFLF